MKQMVQMLVLQRQAAGVQTNGGMQQMAYWEILLAKSSINTSACVKLHKTDNMD